MAKFRVYCENKSHGRKLIVVLGYSPYSSESNVKFAVHFILRLGLCVTLGGGVVSATFIARHEFSFKILSIICSSLFRECQIALCFILCSLCKHHLPQHLLRLVIYFFRCYIFINIIKENGPASRACPLVERYSCPVKGAH